MAELLQVSHAETVTPQNEFLKCEPVEGHEASDTAREAALFDFATTDYEMGARIISIPPNRFFAKHTHPHAHHFIVVLKGTAVMIYDGQRYVLQPGDTCLVRKGIIHKLGAGEDGTRVICVNTPTYEHDDPDHVHYLEEETLDSVALDYSDSELVPHGHVHEHAHSHHH